MGFFSELRDDLSQAVSELMPDEKLNAAMAENKTEDKVEEVNLSDLLDKVESMSANQELDEQPTVTMDGGFGQIEAQEAMISSMAAAAASNTSQMEAENTRMRVATDETAIITSGMTIRGDMVSEGSMELTGIIQGNIDILGKLYIYGKGMIEGNSQAAEIYAEEAQIVGEVNSMGSIKIGANTVIIGNVYATSAVIAGAVKGDIDVRGPVILDASAIVMGNIKSKSVQINNGAVIEGLCSQCYADVNPTSFFEDFKVGR